MKYFLPAFALLWLAMIWASTLHGDLYFPAHFAPTRTASALVLGADPQAVRLGLTPGTRVDVSGMSFADRRRLRYGSPEGTPFALHVISGTARTIVVPARWLGYRELLPVRILDLLSMTFSLLLAAFLAYRKPGVMIASLILFLGGGALSWPRFVVLANGLPDALYAALSILLAALCNWFPVLVLASFVVRFPDADAGGQHRLAVRIIDGIVVAGFFVALSGELRTIGRPEYVICTALSGVVILAASFVALAYAKPSDRGRVGIVFAAVTIGGAGYAANMIVYQYAQNFALFFTYATLSIVLVPLAVTYSILRHRVFDIAFVLNRTVVYAVTSAVVLVALAAMEFAAERYLSDLTRVEGIAVEFAIALVIIVSARIIHSRVDRAVDRMLFRVRHEQEWALRRFATTLQFYTAQQPLIRDTIDALLKYARVEGSAVYLAAEKRLECAASVYPVPAPAVDENDPAFVELRAHQQQLQIHDAATAFRGDRLYPMFLAGRLIGVISTGEREGGEQMPPDIDESIQRIAAALAVALAAIETDRVRDENAVLHARLAGATI